MVLLIGKAKPKYYNCKQDLKPEFVIFRTVREKEREKKRERGREKKRRKERKRDRKR